MVLAILSINFLNKRSCLYLYIWKCYPAFPIVVSKCEVLVNFHCFALIFVQSEKRNSVSYCMWIYSFPHQIWIDCLSLQHIFLAPLLKITWLSPCGFLCPLFGSSVCVSLISMLCLLQVCNIIWNWVMWYL